MISFYCLDFREKAVGGAVVSPTLYDEHFRELPVEVQFALRDFGQLTFLVHGFDNSRAEGREKMRFFAKQLREVQKLPGDHVLVAVLWPGDTFVGGALWGLLGKAGYAAQEGDADTTADALTQCIRTVLRPRVPMHFVAHSLGCRVTLETMRRLDLVQLRTGERLETGNVLLMAGAVDADALARRSRYRAAVEGARRIAVLHSREDDAVNAWFKVGDVLAGIFDGWWWEREALGAVGPKPAGGDEVPRNVDARELRYEHSDYLPTYPGLQVGPTQQDVERWAVQVVSGAVAPLA